MTAPALRLVTSIEEVRDRLPDIPRVALPSFQDVGRQADATVGRLRGRPARPSWRRPLLILVGAVGLMAAIAAMAMTRTRNRPRRWSDEDAPDRMTESLGSNSGLGGPSDPVGLHGIASPGLAVAGAAGPADLENEIP